MSMIGKHLLRIVEPTPGVPWTAMPGDKPPTALNAQNDEFDVGTGLNTTKWTWLNQGTATATQNGSGVLTIAVPLTATATSRALLQSAPSFPATVTARMTAGFRMVNFSGAGLVLRDSATSRLIHYNVGFVNGQTISVDRWTNETTFSATARTKLITGSATSEGALTPPYLRIDLGAASANYYWSFDGVSWTFFVNETYAAFLTPNQIGISVISNSSAPAYDANYFWFRVS
jgi:hypothetical protein